MPTPRLPRRARPAALLRALALLALPLLALPARAQSSFPEHPVHLINPFAAGGPVDAVARILGRALEARWGQPLVVESRTGAAGNIGAAAVAQAAADGYTLLLGTSGLMTVNPHLYPNPGFDFATAFAPVEMLGALPNVMVIPAASTAQTVAEFIAQMRAAGRPMLFGSPGAGSYIHVTGVLFAREVGLQADHVAYRGSAPALTDLAGRRFDVMFENLPGALGFIRDGRIRALAVTSAARAPTLPDVPTTREAGIPGVATVSWFAVFAPGRTPEALRRRIATDIAEVKTQPAVRAALENLGLDIASIGPERLGALVLQERTRLGELVRAATIRAE